MANIRRRDGPRGTTYRVTIRVAGHTPVYATFDRRTDAVRWAQQEEVRLRSSRSPAASSRFTVGDAIKRYGTEELPGLAATERRNRTAQLAWWEEQLGTVELRALSRDMLRRLLASLASGEVAPAGRPVSVATVNRYQAALSAVLSAALDWEWAEVNPLHSGSRRKRPNSQRERERDREVTAEEYGRLLAAFKQSPDRRLYVLALCARASGAREGELMRLRFEDSDLSAVPPRIEVMETKGGGSRVLYFPGSAGDELRALPRHPSGYVFGAPGKAHEDGPPEFPRQAFKYWSRRSGVEGVWFHDFRHSWACHLLDEGASLPQLMILGGWRSVAMVRRYAQRAQRAGNPVLAALDRALR
jgi:integrase